MIRKILVVFILLLVAGCSLPDPYETQQKRIERRVYEVTLEDGTRCVIFQASYKGGIDCDFRNGEYR